MFKIKNLLLFLTSSTLMLSSFTYAANAYDVEKSLYEVITTPEGEEIIFKANGIKPEIVFEERIVITNEKDARKKIDYIKKISNSMFFFEYKNTEKIKAMYSEDGISFHESLDRKNDHYIKIIIKDVLPNEINSLKIRYEHNLFGISG